MAEVLFLQHMESQIESLLEERKQLVMFSFAINYQEQ